MISAFFSKYKLLAYVGILVVCIITFGYYYNKYNNVLTNNILLTKEVEDKTKKISELEVDIKFKDDVISDVKTRLDRVSLIQEQRRSNVKTEKADSRKFHQDTIDTISTPNPEIKIDTYLVDRYNRILECIEEVSNDAKDNC